MLEFENNLKKIRESKGFTQEELAKLCEVRRETIIRCETGVNIPSVYLASKLAFYLRCSLDEMYHFNVK